MKVRLFSPDQLQNNNLADIARLILQGGQIMTGARSLAKRVQDADTFALAYDDENLAGVVAMKKPSLEYRSKVFNTAGSDMDPDYYRYELGWLAISPIYQGLVTPTVVSNLLSRYENVGVYTTIRAKNTRLRDVARRYGFLEAGCTFTLNEHPLVLLVR